MGESLTNTKRKRVRQPKERKWMKYALSLLVLGLIAASAYVVIRSTFPGEEEVYEASAKPDTAVDPEQLTNPERFKEAYIERNGGLEHLQSLQTLRTDGRILSKEKEVDFVVLRRRPDMMLMTQKLGRSKVTYGSKGGEHWKRESLPGQKETVTDVAVEQIDALTDAVEMFGPLLTAYLKEDRSVESIEQSEWEGRKALKIRILNAEEDASDLVYVDPDDLEVIAQVTKKPEGQDIVSEFSDYKTISRVSIPFTTIVQQGDDILSRVILEDARFNVGASSFVFER